MVQEAKINLQVNQVGDAADKMSALSRATANWGKNMEKFSASSIDSLSKFDDRVKQTTEHVNALTKAIGEAVAAAGGFRNINFGGGGGRGGGGGGGSRSDIQSQMRQINAEMKASIDSAAAETRTRAEFQIRKTEAMLHAAGMKHGVDPGKGWQHEQEMLQKRLNLQRGGSGSAVASGISSSSPLPGIARPSWSPGGGPGLSISPMSGISGTGDIARTSPALMPNYDKYAKAPNPRLPGESRPQLGKHILQSLEEYTAGSGVNLALTGQMGWKDAGDEDIEKVHSHLQEAFAKAKTFKKPVTVHRGMSIDEDVMGPWLEQIREAAKTGKPLRLAGYQSATTDKGVAEKWPGEIKMEIEALRGLDLKHIGQHPKQQELLLGHNELYKIHSLKEEGGKMFLKMSQIIEETEKSLTGGPESLSFSPAGIGGGTGNISRNLPSGGAGSIPPEPPGISSAASGSEGDLVSGGVRGKWSKEDQKRAAAEQRRISGLNARGEHGVLLQEAEKKKDRTKNQQQIDQFVAANNASEQRKKGDLGQAALNRMDAAEIDAKTLKKQEAEAASSAIKDADAVGKSAQEMAEKGAARERELLAIKMKQATEFAKTSDKAKRAESDREIARNERMIENLTGVPPGGPGRGGGRGGSPGIPGGSGVPRGAATAVLGRVGGSLGVAAGLGAPLLAIFAIEKFVQQLGKAGDAINIMGNGATTAAQKQDAYTKLLVPGGEALIKFRDAINGVTEGLRINKEQAEYQKVERQGQLQLRQDTLAGQFHIVEARNKQAGLQAAMATSAAGGLFTPSTIERNTFLGDIAHQEERKRRPLEIAMNAARARAAETLRTRHAAENDVDAGIARRGILKKRADAAFDKVLNLRDQEEKATSARGPHWWARNMPFYLGGSASRKSGIAAWREPGFNIGDDPGTRLKKERDESLNQAGHINQQYGDNEVTQQQAIERLKKAGLDHAQAESAVRKVGISQLKTELELLNQKEQRLSGQARTIGKATIVQKAQGLYNIQMIQKHGLTAVSPEGREAARALAGRWLGKLEETAGEKDPLTAMLKKMGVLEAGEIGKVQEAAGKLEVKAAVAVAIDETKLATEIARVVTETFKELITSVRATVDRNAREQKIGQAGRAADAK